MGLEITTIAECLVTFVTGKLLLSCVDSFQVSVDVTNPEEFFYHDYQPWNPHWDHKYFMCPSLQRREAIWQFQMWHVFLVFWKTMKESTQVRKYLPAQNVTWLLTNVVIQRCITWPTQERSHLEQANGFSPVLILLCLNSAAESKRSFLSFVALGPAALPIVVHIDSYH